MKQKSGSVQQAVVNVLTRYKEIGPLHYTEIAKYTSLNKDSVCGACNELRRKGITVWHGRGMYSLSDNVQVPEDVQVMQQQAHQAMDELLCMVADVSPGLLMRELSMTRDGAMGAMRSMLNCADVAGKTPEASEALAVGYMLGRLAWNNGQQ